MDQVSGHPEAPVVVDSVSGGQQQPVAEQGTEEQSSMSLSSGTELGLSHVEEKGTAAQGSGLSDPSSDTAGPTGEMSLAVGEVTPPTGEVSLAKKTKEDITEYYIAQFRQGLNPHATLQTAEKPRQHKLCWHP